MTSIRSLIRRNVGRAHHWLPFVPERSRELTLLIPALFCLGEHKAGIFSHPTCTPEQYALLAKHLGTKPDISVSRLPDRIMVQSLVAVPRPSVVNTDRLHLILVIVPSPGAPLDVLRRKAEEVERFLGQRDMHCTACIPAGQIPPLGLQEIMRTGVVLGGRHPVADNRDETDMGIFLGEVPGRIYDPTSLSDGEWNPFRHVLDQETRRLVAEEGYAPRARPDMPNPFLDLPLQAMVRHEEALALETLVRLRLCMGALFCHFGPTREAMACMAKAWGMSPNEVPDASTLGIAEAVTLRTCLVPLDEHELPVFSWPACRAWRLERATLEWDGSGWRIAETGIFRHRHAWVVLAWAAIAGLIGEDTVLKAPDALGLRGDAAAALARMPGEIARGMDTIVPPDTRQGSIRFSNGRFTASDAPVPVPDPGRTLPLILFRERRKKALLDTSGL